MNERAWAQRLALIAAVVVMGLVYAPDAPRAGARSANGGPPVRIAPAGSDWRHALQVVANLRAQPPRAPLVLMLGSSTVRESTVSDASWAGAVRRKGGPRIAAYNLGSGNQTFDQNVRLVSFLPRRPTIVFIGVDLIRFTAPRSTPSFGLPSPAAVPSTYDPHRYSVRRILTIARKHQLVQTWLRDRYPVFRRQFDYNLGRLEAVIRACLNRGLHPVLLDTPRNTPLIGHSFDAPIARCTASCKALAARFSIPFVRLVSAARFSNGDFYDLWHAVEPARSKWQPLLAAETVRLLRGYGM